MKCKKTKAINITDVEEAFRILTDNAKYLIKKKMKYINRSEILIHSMHYLSI